jgi:hypothetical protein
VNIDDVRRELPNLQTFDRRLNAAWTPMTLRA